MDQTPGDSQYLRSLCMFVSKVTTDVASPWALCAPVEPSACPAELDILNAYQKYVDHLFGALPSPLNRNLAFPT